MLLEKEAFAISESLIQLFVNRCQLYKNVQLTIVWIVKNIFQKKTWITTKLSTLDSTNAYQTTSKEVIVLLLVW